MKHGAYYLNNTGSRWIVYVNGNKETIFAYVNCKLIARRVINYESMGNFAVAYVSYKGKRIMLQDFSTDATKLNLEAHNHTI